MLARTSSSSTLVCRIKQTARPQLHSCQQSGFLPSAAYTMAKPCHFDKHGQLCVLSVDDDSVNLLVIEQLLGVQGWKVVSCAEAQEAYAALDEGTWPDVIFLDYQMGAGDTGDEICKKIRKILGDVQIPIIMCSAMTAGSDAMKSCIEAGATDVLLKPYDRVKMVEIVQKHCPAKTTGSAAPPTQLPQPPQPTASPEATTAIATASASGQDLISFLTSKDLEYCGKKLSDQGVTLQGLKALDDAALRKLGIVVKSQRDKIIEAAKSLP